MAEFEVEEKSWHLLAILLRIGHPVQPQHLASQCSLFTVTPGFVRHVTSLPSSPLSVTDNGLVTPSSNAVFALERFFSLRFLNFQPSPFRKRKSFFSSTQDGRYHKRLAINNRVHEISLESFSDKTKAMMRGNFPAMKFESWNNNMLHSGNSMIPLSIDTNGEFSIPSFEHREVVNDAGTSMFEQSLFMNASEFSYRKLVGIDRFEEGKLFVDHFFPASFQDPLLCNKGLVCSSIGFGEKVDCFDAFRHENLEQNAILPVDDDGICENNACKDPLRQCNEDEEGECSLKKRLIGSGTSKSNACEDPLRQCNEDEVGESGSKIGLNLDHNERLLNIVRHSAYRRLQKSSCLLKGEQKNNIHPKPQILAESIACSKFDKAPKNSGQYTNDQKFITKQKLKQSCKENIAETTSMTPKLNQVEKKAYPSFETFTIEEEEGSGGYGTVYRARRTTDGKRLAIKCPHDNAPKNHVNNERSMLERFGGKNFIIKFEGSFNSGSSECFVLEHVEHDRPEVLKKEIDIIQLQWYAYCMFRALACLHKEGVVHRDVKPGNFLFSRKQNKGYLIDFNLAMDLNKKYKTGSKPKPSLDASSNIPLPSGSAPLIHNKNFGGSMSLTSHKRELADYRKYSELNRHVKQKAYAVPLKNCPDKAGGSLLRAQGTDGSGITSAKDVTSTRTASAERLREPLPFRGRKELISLVQNSMQCANNSSIKGPSSQRKRVTAPSAKVDGRIVYLTPMPLHSSTVAGGLLRSKGDGKHKREGSCVGTKGFRAPEVLFRSQFQGTKVDIWSAGVTLLYMVIGKTPFTGDPEQNIKDIAKLRGSEELWEVAKLHDRELSFPVELLDVRSLQSWDIESWCKIHTKRPEFLEHIPKSLFDLLDKCLIVNPRNRISVEEVLRHEFFASCNEIMRKQRMIRRGLNPDTAASKNNLRLVS